MQSGLVVVHNAKVVTEDSILDPGFVVLKNQVIWKIGKEASDLKVEFPQATFIDGAGNYLLPGFIDIHVHGGFGRGFMDSNPEGLKALAKGCLKSGTTGFLATTRAAAEEDLLAAFANYRDFLLTGNYPYKASFLGIHMESPFLNQVKRGGQAKEWIRAIDLTELERYLAVLETELKIFSYAPELPGGEQLTKELVKQGIIASIGHSAASYQEAKIAFDLGACHINHCFNGMTDFHHREPGIIGAALDRKDLYLEIICDGHHLHPQTIRMLYLLFGSEQLILITDRTEAAGLPEGLHTINGRKLQVTSQGEIIEAERNIYAGSSLTMNKALFNYMAMAEVSLVEAAKAASLNPARLLGIAERKGSIAVGKDGDLVLLAGDGTVIWTMLQGEICRL